MGLPPSTQFTRQKSALDSKGIIGGVASIFGFGTAAAVLTHMLGVEVGKGDIEGTVANGKLIASQYAAIVSTVAAVIGLWGNWVRKTRIAFENGKNPLASKGIVGNLAAIAAGAVAFFQAVSVDWHTLAAIAGKFQESWTVVAPAVIGIAGALQGVYARWRAKHAVQASPLTLPLPMILAFGILSLTGCASAEKNRVPVATPVAAEGFEPSRPDPLEQGFIAATTAAIFQFVEFEGGYADGELCGGIKIFEFGPRLCLGFDFPTLDKGAVKDREAGPPGDVDKAELEFLATQNK